MTKKKMRAPRMGDQRTFRPANTLRAGEFRWVWGDSVPRYTGWYCALNWHLVTRQKDLEARGGAPRPMTDMKEIVYVHRDGTVHSVCFRYDWKKGKKIRGVVVGDVVLMKSRIRDYCGWEHLLTGSERVQVVK